MKKVLSQKKTAIVLLIAAIIAFVFYEYVVMRPISFGMEYHASTEYEGYAFEGSIKFYSDGTSITKNSNFDQAVVSYYYQKNGYHFLTMASTEDQFAEEIEWIDQNFEEAVKMPFYAYKINAFKMTAADGSGYQIEYTCTTAIVIAIVGGVIEVALIWLSGTAWVSYRKAKRKARLQAEEEDV